MPTDIKQMLPNAPLVQISPGVWHLKANLFLEKGATLLLHGSVIGGDCNELRLQSNNSEEPNSVINITADWGTIDIRNTRITSWDDTFSAPDIECNRFRRAFIRVRSSLNPDGVTKQESRMNIIDSDVGYLGCHEAEAYGLTWKVIGDPSVVLDKVDVFGDIMRSRIHHNFFGVYTWGAFGMRMIDNEVDHNTWYGFDPHDDSDHILIQGNNVHHNGTHGIIGSQRCNNLTVRNNTSWSNGGCGIMYHRYTDDGLIEGNRCLGNGDAGIAIFDSRRNVIRNNVCWGNFKSGIRLSVGAADNLIVSNDFRFGGNYGIYLYKGNDAPKPGDDGRPKGNLFLGNIVQDNSGNGIYLTTADRNTFRGNIFNRNYGPMWFVKGNENLLDGNAIGSDTPVRQQGTPYIGSVVRVQNQPQTSIHIDAYSMVTFQDSRGRVFEPEEGAIESVVTPTGSAMVLTTAEIGKTSVVSMRDLYVVPDRALVLVGIHFWNRSGDFSKRWKLQASSSTRAVSFRVGDLPPNRAYNVLKNGSTLARITADDLGFATFEDRSISTGITDYLVRP